jgi:deoxyribonuclease IV
MRLGAHVSSSGRLANSLKNGSLIDCEIIQIFTSNPRGWTFKVREEEEIAEFLSLKSQSSIESVYGHAIYLTNLASNNPLIYENSVKSLVSGLLLSDEASLEGVITHIGSHGGDGVKKGIERVARALSQVLAATKESKIILETDSGSGNHLGGNFKEIGQILKMVGSKRISVCLDTCHIFAAGYDIKTSQGLETTLEEFEKEIGLKNLKVLHLNDSKGTMGSKRDRHEEIGKGEIGIEAFERIVNHPMLRKLDGIIETPDNKEASSLENFSLKTLKGLRK